MSASVQITPEVRDYVTLDNPPRLLLSGFPWLVHFIGPILLALLTVGLLYLEFVNPPESFSLPPYASMILGLATLFAIYRRRRKLRFIPIASRHTAKQAYDILVEAAGVAGWKIVHDIPGTFVRIWTIPSEDESTNYGELVTVMFSDGVVLINSINDPSDWLHLYSGSANKGHAEWLETTLEKGVWKYDPNRAKPIVEKEQTEFISPQASIVLDAIIGDDPPRLDVIGLGLLREILGWSIIGGLRIGLDIAEDYFNDSFAEIIICVVVTCAILAVVPMLGIFYRSRFAGITTGQTDEENYTLLHTALQEEKWHINYADPTKGIEARIPFSTPEKGELAAFVFRNGVIFVNHFGSADSPFPSFSYSLQASTKRWLRKVLDERDLMQRTSDGTALTSNFINEKEKNSTRESRLRAHVMTTSDPSRLRLRKERWYEVFGFPVAFTLFGLFFLVVFCVTQLLGSSADKDNILLKFALIMLGIGGINLRIRRRRVRFAVVRTNQDASENYRRVARMCKVAKWELLHETPDMLIEAYRRNDEPAEEMITVFCSGQDVYVNSINKLEDSRPNLNYMLTAAKYSPARNRENVERVIQAVTAPKEQMERAEAV